MESVFAMIESTNKYITPIMNLNDNNGVTRANAPQTSLALDSSATIHISSSQEVLHAIKKSNNLMTIHYGVTTLDQAMIGRLQDESEYLHLQKGEVCVVKDGIQICYQWETYEREIPCADGF